MFFASLLVGEKMAAATNGASKSSPPPPPPPVDWFRDTPLRYLGYANELGESFRPLIHKSVVHASYGVAIAYVLADTSSKAQATAKRFDASASSAGGAVVSVKAKRIRIASSAADTLIWYDD